LISRSALRSTTLALAAIVVTTMAACGGGGSTTTATQTTATVHQGPWTIRLADEAKLRPLNVRETDLPTGWTPKGEVGRHEPQVAPSTGIEACYDTPWPDTHETAFLKSPEYSNAGVMVFSNASAYDSPSWVQQSVNNNLGPNGQRCAIYWSTKYADILHWANVNVTISRPKRGSPAPMRYISHETYTDSASGQPVPIVEDTIYVGKGLYATTLNVQARGGAAIPADLETKLVNTLAKRFPSGS
jgi:hypothetical protein